MPAQTCRLCGQPGLKPKFQFAACSVATCLECGLVQVPEALSPQQVAALYEPDYFKHGKYVLDWAGKLEQQRRLGWIARHGVADGAKVLDLGCATGEFALAAKARYQVWGTDISSYAIECAKNLNPEIAERFVAGRFEDLALAGQSFDAVAAWDVVEHLPDPLAVLKKAVALLKPGGVMLLSTPNIGAPLAGLLGRRWAFMTPPEHLNFFSRATLSLLLQEAGLRPGGWMTRGKWVNSAFLIYKLQRIFPNRPSQWLVKVLQRTPLAQLPLYVPSGDIQYAVGIRD